MFQFPGFAFCTYVFSAEYRLRGGFPHSDTFGSKLVASSPKLFAGYHVLHRLLSPRHPPYALNSLDHITPTKLAGVTPKRIDKCDSTLFSNFKKANAPPQRGAEISKPVTTRAATA